jgi:uncharacterized protein YkwD
MNFYPVLRRFYPDQLPIYEYLCVIASMAKMAVYRFRYIIAVAIFIAVLFSPPLTPLASSPVANAIDAPKAQVILRSDAEVFYLNAINQLRADRGLAPLMIDSRLSVSAAQKSADMISQTYWGHYAPNGTSFADYIWAGSPRAERVGENLARCFDNRQDAFMALVNSPTHYAIMTGQFTNIGVAEAVDPVGGCTYTVFHFAEYQIR